MQHKNPNFLKFFYDERKYKIFDDRDKDFLRKLLSKRSIYKNKTALRRKSSKPF